MKFAEIEVMVPVSGVPARTFELVAPWNFGKEGRVLVTHRIDHYIEFEILIVGCSEAPGSVFLITHASDSSLGSDIGVQTKFTDALLEVGFDLRLLDEAGGPVRIGRIRKCIGVGPDVAGEAGVGFIVPGASWLFGFFKDGKAPKTLGEQLMACGDA